MLHQPSPGPADNFAFLRPDKYVCSVKINVKSKFDSGWAGWCASLGAALGWAGCLTWDAGIGQVVH